MISTMAKPNSSMRYCVGSNSREQLLKPSSSRISSVPPIMTRAAIADAELAAHAAEHDDGQHQGRFAEGEALRR